MDSCPCESSRLVAADRARGVYQAQGYQGPDIIDLSNRDVNHQMNQLDLTSVNLSRMHRGKDSN